MSLRYHYWWGYINQKEYIWNYSLASAIPFCWTSNPKFEKKMVKTLYNFFFLGSKIYNVILRHTSNSMFLKFKQIENASTNCSIELWVWREVIPCWWSGVFRELNQNKEIKENKSEWISYLKLNILFYTIVCPGELPPKNRTFWCCPEIFHVWLLECGVMEKKNLLNHTITKRVLFFIISFYTLSNYNLNFVSFLPS